MYRTRKSSRIVVGLLLPVLLLLQACAASETGAGAGPRRATPGSVEPGQPSGSGEGQALGGLGEPVQASPGRVTITLSAPSYAGGQVISAVIANGLDRTVYAENSKSDCSIAVIEQREGVTWQPIVACGLRLPPVTVAIGPSRGRTVTIDPSSSNFAPPLGQLEAGTYRLTFTYRASEKPQGEEPLAARSPAFQITS